LAPEQRKRARGPFRVSPTVTPSHPLKPTRHGKYAAKIKRCRSMNHRSPPAATDRPSRVPPRSGAGPPRPARRYTPRRSVGGPPRCDRPTQLPAQQGIRQPLAVWRTGLARRSSVRVANPKRRTPPPHDADCVSGASGAFRPPAPDAPTTNGRRTRIRLARGGSKPGRTWAGPPAPGAPAGPSIRRWGPSREPRRSVVPSRSRTLMRAMMVVWSPGS
jgi:hypothetical protein